MSNQEATSTTQSCGTVILLSWLAALAVFLIILTWALFHAPALQSGRDAQSSLDLEQTDSGTILEGLPAPGSFPPLDMPFEASQEYMLVAAGLQGFYQNSSPDQVWTMAYSVPQLNAQLLRRGPDSPEIIIQGVKVSWEIDPQTGLAGSAELSGGSYVRQGQMEVVEDSYFQAAIPITAWRGDNIVNPYPLIKLRAEDENGKLLAETATVLAVSPGFGCAHCHENSGMAILEVHDRHQGTNFVQQNAKGEIIACRACHTGSSDGKMVDAKETFGQGLSVSAATHGWHAAYLNDLGAEACMTCHVSLGRTEDNLGEIPHPLLARDFHIDRGLNCVSCHGYMEDHALALLKAEQQAGQHQAEKAMNSLTARGVALFKIEARLPWIQQPDCASCHDFSEKPNPLTASAFNKWTDASEGAVGLFSERKDDMSAMRCINCHGAPHAVYPARNIFSSNLDNIQPLQYQEQAAPLGAYGNCALCHGQSMDFSAHHPIVERSQTKIHTPEGVELSMPVAIFSHQAHTRIVECSVCHHTGHEDGKSLLCASSGCHDGISPSQTSKDGQSGTGPDLRYFRQAFHGGFPSCMACHVQSLAAGKAAGPTTCKACHRAPSKRWANSKQP